MALTQVNAGLIDSTSQPNAFKNRIINGDMRIDQRNSGAAVTVLNAATHLVDRFPAWNGTDGTASGKQDSTVYPAGFRYSLKYAITGADSSLAAGQYAGVAQKIEGYNVADLGFGTASASTVTVSFWVRSSIAGPYGATLRNGAPNRTYAFSYTINAADTWEYKTVTIAGDTSGTWATDNTTGMYLWFSLGAGSTYTAPSANSWLAGSYLTPSGQTNLFATNGATFYITGVQLEKGSTDTSFDYRDYGRELIMCQRYCRPFGAYSFLGQVVSSSVVVAFGCGVPMRATPTLSTTSGFQWTAYSGAGVSLTPAINSAAPDGTICLACTGGSGLTAGQSSYLTGIPAGSHLSAEL